MEFCEDSSLLAVGFSDSILKVWSLVPQKLRGMKPADLLADIDKEAGTFLCPREVRVVKYYKSVVLLRHSQRTSW